MRQALIRGAGGLLALCLLVPAACAGSSPIGTTSLGSGGQDGGTGGGGGAGGGSAVGDAMPQNAVSFFQAKACPSQWAPYDTGVGRVLVPAAAGTAGGVPHGTPLAGGEDRTHTHALALSFTLGTVKYVGAAGGGNHGVAAAGTLGLMATSDPASTGLPYVQMLACKKLYAAVPGKAPLPAGMELFFDAPACPSGWKAPAATQGRFLVGLPSGAPADQTFGGPPVTSITAPSHTHGATGTLATTSHGIALASGCCADGYGANGTYMATATTDATEAGLPYLELLACEKQ